MTRTDPTPYPAPTEGKSFVTAWLLSWLLGGLGADRFYLGKIGTGILKLVTLGGLGVWYLLDLIFVLSGSTVDSAGRSLSGFERARLLSWVVTTGALLLALLAAAVTGAIAA